MGLVAEYGIGIQNAYDYYYNSGSEDYVHYTTTGQTVFLGIEPTLMFSKNIGIYSTLGIVFAFSPNSKQIDTANPAFDPATRTYPLREAKDAHVNIATNGCSLGMRYYF